MTRLLGSGLDGGTDPSSGFPDVDLTKYRGVCANRAPPATLIIDRPPDQRWPPGRR